MCPMDTYMIKTPLLPLDFSQTDFNSNVAQVFLKGADTAASEDRAGGGAIFAYANSAVVMVSN